VSYLVDTNAWIGFFEGSADFGANAKSVMVDTPQLCFISTASVWEAAIKIGLGKLILPYDLKEDLPTLIEQNGFQRTGIDFEDAVEAKDLPRIHGDPFDRIQAIQARRRDWQVISRDPVFAEYGLKRVW
jgi:PIN domain nuclease of toxin-antitoxin system